MKITIDRQALAKLLCAEVNAINAGEGKFTFEDLQDGEMMIGDWEVVVRQTRSPEGTYEEIE